MLPRGLEVLSVNGLVQARGRFLLVLAPLALLLVAVTASRSEAAEGRVSATTVVEGLKTIQQGLADAVAAGDDTAKAHEAVEAVEPVWAMIEGTVKANDETSYAALEKSIEDLEAAIKAGDARSAGGAVDGFTSAFTDYSAKFPASGAAKSSAPAPTRTAAAAAAADRSAAAAAPAEAGDATLARTGSASDALAALAGLALALGGLLVIGGARRRPSPIL